MILLPAIDLYDGKVVRLTKGDYAQMTVYRDDPAAQAADFQAAGAKWLHTVDLEGAKDGTTPNFPVIAAICKKTDLKVEIGGGIRSLDTIQKYLDAGVSRVILGTAAVTDPKFLERALDRFGSQAAVGVDLKDGAIAIKGWKASRAGRRPPRSGPRTSSPACAAWGSRPSSAPTSPRTACWGAPMWSSIRPSLSSSPWTSSPRAVCQVFLTYRS